MNESRLFMLINGVTTEKVAATVENFMRASKGMEVQSAQTTDGYVIQGSQPRDGWKTISGTRLAITVQLITSGQNLNVMVGEGQWSDKLGAGALGWFVAWPLAVTAGFGAYKQKKLPEEIFNVIEKCLLSGGQMAVISGAGAVLAANEAVCPQCRAKCEKGAKFCPNCGAKLSLECPACGASLKPGSKFCSECGHAL